MSGESAIVAEGVVVEAFPNGTYKIGLANGHTLLGYVTRGDKARCASLGPGCRVRLKLSVCDLSKGRIQGPV
jgi:translation initiation factor IF-1